MDPEVLMDSNVFISFKYEQDANHTRAVEVLDGLEPFPRLTEEAAYEVVAISRAKLNALVKRIFSETSALDEKTSTERKGRELEELFGRLEVEENLGTFLKVVHDFSIGELGKGRSTLEHLVEWATDEVTSITQDILDLCRVTGFDMLPGPTSDEDMESIRESADILGIDIKSKDKDTLIFWDALAFSRFHRDVVLITFDRGFVRRAKRDLELLSAAGAEGSGNLTVLDINETDLP
jgi:predicted nucleic acid-binding protein